ncbi:bestrophin family protein [Pseudoxanthomonas sp. X-1]|uniref:bestrophin family protein n=1 Tax=Pseudoxanthomonas sp. X-1 TaxID=2571115 RepID=UPI00110B34D3|nr:bestrophin family protein [Pseudoxanthomonas sp. X-1]TMN18752.1 bestrophin [Pseudoxanthomonas sp. X-1]UAY74468.1 bestrophin family protein [Pseudoxanthomonas sp. X-1]
MILRPRPTTWQLLYLTRGSILPLVAPRLLFVGAVACLASWFAQRHPPAFAQITVAPFTLIGIALSLFLGFRNSACHERWWEGRKQWGALLVHTRALARQTDALLAQAPELRIELLRAAIGFTHALNARLRGGQVSAAAAPWLPAEPAAAIAAAPNPTDAVLGWMSRRLGQALHDQQVHPLLYPSLAAPVAGLGEVQAACERIHGTPLPFAYTLLLHRTALLFCTLLPFGLAGDRACPPLPSRPRWRCKAVRFAPRGAGLTGRQAKPRGAKMAALQRQPEGPPLRAPGTASLLGRGRTSTPSRFLAPGTRKGGAAYSGVEGRP